VDEVFLEICEALVADKVLLDGKGEISALALVAKEVVALSREANEAGEVVLAVKLEKRLKGGQTSKCEGLGLGDFNLGALPLEDYLVLLVTWAKRKRS
jgi:hypothetical protein